MPAENSGTADFLRDVATHELTIIRNDGLYRHLRFKRPGSSCMYFDLITWPGHLCYTGDMGTYVFSRISDMLEFFRRDTESEELPINPSYWSEKVQATDGGRHPGCVFEYDHGKYLAVVNEYLADWLEGLSEDHQEELKEAVQDDVLSLADDHDEHGNYSRAYGFSTEVGGQTYQFTDFFERSMRRFTDRYIWCCRALVWGIEKYDAAMLPAGIDSEGGSHD